jgi:predicted HTH domain antitoxin
MTLTLPDDPALAGFPEDQLRLELACALYGSRGISRGLGAKLAGIDGETFEAELHRRGIANGYQTSDLAADLAALDSLIPR